MEFVREITSFFMARILNFALKTCIMLEARGMISCD